jgi:serine/threonine protein kinase
MIGIIIFCRFRQINDIKKFDYDILVYLMLLYPVTKDYEQHELIGDGNYGTVTKTKCGKYAIKRIRDKSLNIHLIKEFILLKTIKNAGLIELKDCYCSNTLGKWDIAIVMPVYNMSLLSFYPANKKQPNYPAQVQTIMSCVCRGLYELHRHGILHLDIKPDNILINPTTMDVRLIDFGISQYVGCITHKQLWMDIVTLWYRPPEIINKDKFDHTVDVWSVGCVLGELIYGKPLFTGDRNAKIKAAQASRHYKTWQPIAGLEQMASVLEKTLAQDPKERASISWLLRKLGHKVQSITTVNKEWLRQNYIVKSPIIDAERSARLNHIISTMHYVKCNLETIVNTIAWMDLFHNQDDTSRSWMACVENLQENPFTEIRYWAGNVNKYELIQFERSIVDNLNRMHFAPIISNFTDGTPVELALCLIVMYDGEYISRSPVLLGKAIKKLISNKSGEPDAMMTFVMGCLENTSKDCAVLDIVEEVRSYII